MIIIVTKNMKTDRMSADCLRVSEISSLATSTFFMKERSLRSLKTRTNRSKRRTRTKPVCCPLDNINPTYIGKIEARSIIF